MMNLRTLTSALCLLATCGAALAATDVATVYNGQSSLPPTIKVGDWGGDGKDVAAIRPVAVKSAGYGITVSSLGRYQGTRFDFTTPIDTAQFFGQKDAFIELFVRALPSDNDTDRDKNQVKMPDISNLHFTFFTTDGIGTYSVPATDFYPCRIAQNGWYQLDLPLCKLTPKMPMSGAMSRLVISTDEASSFLLGRLAFVREVSALRISISTFPAVLEVGKQIYFASGADAGITPYEVAWDFDTASGATIDATGERVTYTYVNPGTYTVTCTVRDVNGVRDPVTVTKEIHVVRSGN